MNRSIRAFVVALGILALPPCGNQSAAAPVVQPITLALSPQQANAITFPSARSRFVRVLIFASRGGESCIDELEIYGPDGKQNIALAAAGAKASASSCLPGYAIHQITHLNDGRYGNDHSWIAATTGREWAQIELPAAAEVAKIVLSRDRNGHYTDRMPAEFEVQLSSDGRRWTTVAHVKTPGPPAPAPPLTAAVPLPESPQWEELLRYAFLCERITWEHIPQGDALSPEQHDRPALPGGQPYWKELSRLDGVARVLRQTADMLARLNAKRLTVTAERVQLAELEKRHAALGGKPHTEESEALYLDARLQKRRLMLRDPDLAPLEHILLVKRHPYTPSHNYSDVLDSAFRPGGGVCRLDIPRRDGRLEPAEARLTTLFDAPHGIARDAVADFDGQRIYFAYRPSDRGPGEAYWHLYAGRVTKGPEGRQIGNLPHEDQPRQLTEGPFHDYYPCPLPDGGLAFVSTRCHCRFLCWRPQAFVLFRMDVQCGAISPLSYANLSEWAPSVMGDGRILWTRSEYLDKGADFGHTLWAIRPDGTHPMLLFGNNTRNCYLGAREVPGTRELCCTLISHGGDLNGPIGLVDVGQGPRGIDAITNITPDVAPHYHMSWAQRECFRDPTPVSRDYFLVSHAPADRFGLYVIDRWGNRELLYLDPAMGSVCPTPLLARPAPPVLRGDVAETDDEPGEFAVADVYRGLGPEVPRGSVKYLRVCQEVRSELEPVPGGYRSDHPPFQDFYATPTHKVTGPNGWPTYVAKASLGIVPVEADGSARFTVPSGKVLYFQLLDEDLNEIQRMRSVVQLQPGERRSCIGCHESRTSAPPVGSSLALAREPRPLEPPSWGAEPFSYEKVVQPVWNARCVGCHDARDKRHIDLTAALDADRVPASYRTLISQGWVHYFDMTWGQEHRKAEPRSFGTLRSRLWKLLDAGHEGVTLSRDERHRIKCWIDLNCPLWPDYRFRLDRPLAGMK
jgi:hypothetical protein